MDELVSEEDYTYQGGMYVFNGYSEWYDREWEGYGRESFVEDIESMADEDGKIPSRKDVLEHLEEWYDFLKDNERDELADEVMKEPKDYTPNKKEVRVDGEPVQFEDDNLPF